MRPRVPAFIIIVCAAAFSACDNRAATSSAADTSPLSQADAPVIPALEEPVASSIKSIHRRGLAAGLRPDVFAKIGDSITAYRPFLYDIGDGAYDLAGAVELGAFIASLRAVTAGEGQNPLNRVSLTARRGWRAGDALTRGTAEPCPALTPVECEVEAIRPAYALVMFGTNDLSFDYETFERNLDAIAAMLIARGVIPILSTFPDAPWGEREAALVDDFNTGVIAIAARRGIPVINYWRALQALPERGIGPDGVHPSVSPRGGGDLTADGLRYGYNQRAYTFLTTLKTVRGALGYQD